MIWFSLYYFILEMQLTQSLLTDTMKDFLIKKKRLRLIKYLSGIFIVGYCMAFAYTLSVIYHPDSNYNEYKAYYDALLAFIKHSKLILDTYFEYMFIKLLAFFFRFKLQKRR
jgi:hypothetical protein